MTQTTSSLNTSNRNLIPYDPRNAKYLFGIKPPSDLISPADYTIANSNVDTNRILVDNANPFEDQQKKMLVKI